MRLKFSRVVSVAAVAAAVCGFALTALADWTYDTSAKTISDGNWTLKASASGQNLTVTGFTSANDLAELRKGHRLDDDAVRELAFMLHSSTSS